MSRATGVRDLAGRLTGFLQKLFPQGDVDVLFRAASSHSWQRLSGKEGGDLAAPDEDASLCDSVLDGGRRIHSVRRLVDSSLACVTVTSGTHAKTYTAEDLIPFRLSVNLFDHAYHVLVLRKHEKDLVFSLNHRLLQLSSLIDTGIDPVARGAARGGARRQHDEGAGREVSHDRRAHRSLVGEDLPTSSPERSSPTSPAGGPSWSGPGRQAS